MAANDAVSGDSAFVQQPEKYWDRLFAPGGHAAMITTVDREGRVNAASYATCVRIVHKPVQIAFTTSQAGEPHVGPKSGIGRTP